MTGQEGGFSQAARRFIAEVDTALTRARRATREARAVSEDFRGSTGELGAQAKTGKLRGVRRGDVRATTPESRAEAVEFRTANGFPVDELPEADTLMARVPAPEPAPAPEQEDFSQHRVLFDVDGPGEADEATDQAADEAVYGESDRIDSPDPEPTRTSDEDEDFSQQRILFDATVESYRPEEVTSPVFEPSEPEVPSSEASSGRRRDAVD